jgi:hypothetical protein
MTEQDQEFAHFWGYETDGLLTQDDIDNTFGVDPETGDTSYTYQGIWFLYPGQIKVVDQNEDGVLDDEDKVNMGSANPDFYYGFNLSLEAYGVDLSMFWQGSYGNELINSMAVWSKFPDEGNANLSAEVLNAWTPTNTNTTVPRLAQGNGIQQTYFNDYVVEDASYLRLKNIQLGYTLPETISKMVGMQRFRVYVSAENLLTFTKYSGYDPEVGNVQYSDDLQRMNPFTAGLDDANYPIAKRVLIGLNVTF